MRLPPARTPMSDDHAPTTTPAEIPTAAPNKDRFRTVASLVLVNTGHGKGKSSAAFGVVLRALAMGWPVAVVQFLKSGDWHAGEEKLCRRLEVDWYAAGDGFTWDSEDLDQSKAKAIAGWDFAKGLIAGGTHRLIVLDEISYAMTWGWVDPLEVAAVIEARPEKLNRDPDRAGHGPGGHRRRRHRHRDEGGQARLRSGDTGQEGNRLLAHTPFCSSAELNRASPSPPANSPPAPPAPTA